MWLAALALAAAAGLWWRVRRGRAMHAFTMQRRKLGSDGVVIGGEGFELPRAGAPAILLLHGGGDTPQTLRYLAAELHARGFHVAAPLLPGHGRTLREFARVSANDLSASAASAYARLCQSHEWVAVIGLSMGGALGVQLAAQHPEMPALGLLAPYLAMPRRIAWIARLAPFWGLIVPAVRSGDGRSIHDPAEQDKSLAYGVFTPRALLALRETARRAADALPRVAAPTLVIQSREDNRIAADNTTNAFARLGATEKHLVWVGGAGHIITVDYGRDAVIDRMVTFMEAHAPPRVATRRETRVTS